MSDRDSVADLQSVQVRKFQSEPQSELLSVVQLLQELLSVRGSVAVVVSDRAHKSASVSELV